ncbi:hypothetical protein MKW94_022734 [Papaver nudicaule]|uniref:F-box domain-containing protein n=1 Tax=Papaver nudicaule TaxID=74823 RepID=A0AA41S7H2_PAPNU|nr:hypothetical protein [Papaver nudicaule]
MKIIANSLDIIATQVSGTFPDDILIEILSRLPVKSLMRFMSVCKHWRFFIKQNRHFIDLHFDRSKSRPNLLYINPMHEKGIYYLTALEEAFLKSQSLRQSISWAEIVEGSGGGGGEEEVQALTSKDRITDDRWFLYNKVLEPVNGLVCFVDWNAYAIRVYNVSTRETTTWVKSTLLAEENDKLENEDSRVQITSLRKPIYQIGFDPEKRECKVFCLWRLIARRQRLITSSTDRPDYVCWEAFTVGCDTKWRRINAVPNECNQIKIKQVFPPDNNRRRQLYANGTLYWSNKEYSSDLRRCSNPDDPSVIVAFDVGSEKYRVIPIPDFILEERRHVSSLFDYKLPIAMLVLGAHVALIFRMERNVVKLWMLDDGGVDKKLENCRGNKSNWSTETITLPFYGDNWIDGVGVAGSSDKILFECLGCKDKVKFHCLYSFDLRKKSYKKIEMDGVSSFTHYSNRSLVTTFTESLYHVQPLNKRSFVSPSLEVM